MELMGCVEADEECGAVAVQDSFSLSSVALVVPLQHQIITPSLHELVPEKPLVVPAISRIRPAASFALKKKKKKTLFFGFPSVAFVLSDGDKWAVTASNWQRAGPLNHLSSGTGTECPKSN